MIRLIRFMHPFLLFYFLKIAVGGDGHGVINKCIHNERQALLHFKSSLEDPYDLLSTWGGEEDDCCKWSGVMCNNQTGHVTKLHLSPNSYGSYYVYLGGEISPSLLNLTYLNHLDLSGNWFNGTVPTVIGSMTRLRYLNLGGNSFNGTVHNFISSLTELRYLDLVENRFSGSIPRSIGSLTEIRYLDLGRNNFSGTIPGSIGSLTELRCLDLGLNDFTGTIPGSIGSLTELRYLDLGWNNFSGTIPGSIGSLTELRYLRLSKNTFHGVIPIEFGNLTNLQELSLGYLKRCTIENMDWLSRLSHLKSLDMTGTSLAKVNHWVNAILNLQKLTSLTLIDCDLSQVMYPYSSSFLNSSSSSSIATLHLESNNLNSSMYSWMFPLTSNRLQSIDLSDNMLDGIPKYLGNLCSLKSLALFDNSAVVKFPDFLTNLSSGCTSVTFQELYVSDSQLIGSLSDEIQMFSSLEYLVLARNHLSGPISEKVWELPKLKDLSVTSNSFVGVISEKLGTSKLLRIDLSNNSLEGVLSEAHMSNLSYVEYITLSSCKLGPRFPKWILTLKNLTSLDIANNRISDTIPLEFWNMWPSRLTYLNLSTNNISGTVSNLSANFDLHRSEIDLSSNNFSGPILDVPSSLVSLNLSRNKFNGGLFFLCKIVDGFLSFLDLSHNSFTGQLPYCLRHFKELVVLNLGENNLSGRLPTSIGYLGQLEVLYLYKNRFSRELPLSLKNCTTLKFLDLGGNMFSGNLPVWIGDNLSKLYALSLRSNSFFGTIPFQLCQLVNLQILDLSMNNLFGTIPTCLNNLTLMVQKGLSEEKPFHLYGQKQNDTTVTTNIYTDHLMIEWHGSEQEFTSNLRLLKSIDLSSNNLTSQIPNEITNLHGLFALNLSKNALLGEIPQKIGEMKNLLVLDLSRNKISGGLPSSMSEMTLLDYLDVSYNNLSGRIPSSTQLQSFDPSRYTGNTGLCGPPISKFCPGDRVSELPPHRGDNEGDGEDFDELHRWFYIGGATGFATGFCIACSVLHLNHHGRHAFLHFLNSLKDCIYVTVMVFVSKWQRFAHT